MKRIGIAATQIAKGNLWVHNFYVLMLSGLFSLLIFLLSGFVLLVGFAIFSVFHKAFAIYDPVLGFSPTFVFCMAALACVVGIMNMVAIIMNIRLK